MYDVGKMMSVVEIINFGVKIKKILTYITDGLIMSKLLIKNEQKNAHYMSRKAIFVHRHYTVYSFYYRNYSVI